MATGSTKGGASSSWSSKLQEAQKLAAEGAKQEFAKEYSKAFALYVRAGELYLWLVRNHDTLASSQPSRLVASTSYSSDLTGQGGDVKARIRKAAEKVLHRAQMIKSLRRDIRPVQKRVLNEEEQNRALTKASRIGRVEYQVLRGEPPASSFRGSQFSSSTQATPTLAPAHLERNVRYTRRTDNPPWASDSLFDAKRLLTGKDVVQDVINDCSFVAALEVAVEHDRKWGTRLATAPLYPKDVHGNPCWSENGRYIVKMLLNGDYRSVEIDEGIPCDEAGQPVCAVGIAKNDHGAQLQLWPSLLEKAYLSLRGGYDVGGSNSSIDLHALTGWIPEHVGFRHSGFQREKTWSRIFEAYQKGYLMITAGTGGDDTVSQTSDGIELVKSHNYAILELFDKNGRRGMVLMNPWRRERSWTQDMRSALTDDQGPEVLTLSWDEACTRLDSLHLSWDCSLSAHSAQFHSIWPSCSRKSASDLDDEGQNIQVALELGPETGDRDSRHDVWLLLVKHLNQQNNLTSNKMSDWIAVHAFNSQDALRTNDNRCKGMYVDSTHVLIHFKAKKGKYVVVASRQDGRASGAAERASDDTSFTVSAYSFAPIRFQELDHSFAYDSLIEGEWTTRTAGGSALYPTFLNNPQYRVILPSPGQQTSVAGPVRIVAETNRDIALQVMLVWGIKGSSAPSAVRRIDNIVPGDVVCSSGPYSHGLAIAEAASLKTNTPYVLIISTYSPNLTGKFAVRVHSQDDRADVQPIAGEGAGMYQQRLRSAWSIAEGTACGAPRFGHYRKNPSFLIEVSRPTRFSIRLALCAAGAQMQYNDADGEKKATEAQKMHRPHINVAILQRDSGREVASSGPYADQLCGVLLYDVTLESGAYVIIPSTFDPDVEASFSLMVYSDRPVQVQSL